MRWPIRPNAIVYSRAASRPTLSRPSRSWTRTDAFSALINKVRSLCEADRDDGYLDDEAATAEIKKFSWLHTGDIGRRDADGYFYITDRKRDMIISGGFNIFPFEVESTLMEHAGVQDCAVIGVPDEKWGEAVKACVQLKSGSNVCADELIAFVKGKIGSMKAPKSIDFIANLPRSP